MTGHDSGMHQQFTRITKYFNYRTITGKKNCALAFYLGINAIILYLALKTKKKAVTAS